MDIDDDKLWYDAITDDHEYPLSQRFDEYGNYRPPFEVQSILVESVDKCLIYHTNKHLISTIIDDKYQLIYNDTYESHEHDIRKISANNKEIKASVKPIQVKTSNSDYEKQRPLFVWLPLDVIKKTYELTTQYTRIPMSTILKKRYISPNPSMNVHRRNEPVVIDTIFSDTPAIGRGVNT